MNSKQTGAIFLVAGTCIGGGTIALPMMLAKVGIVPSLVLMFCIWAFTYYTALLNLDLNLKAGKGLSLGELGRHFSGRVAESLGVVSLKLLSYALLAVFIYGSSSILEKLSGVPFQVVIHIVAALSFLVLLLPLKIIDYINRTLFLGLLGVFGVLILGLLWVMKWDNLPLFTDQSFDFSMLRALLPLIFTSFGFQGSFHTIMNYCDLNAKTLRTVFFWGSLIPAVVYLLWTMSVLIFLNDGNPEFYQKMVTGKVEVGAFVEALSHSTQWSFVQMLVWWVSLLAIVTSLVGVGVGLHESLKSMIKVKCGQNALSSAATIIPPYIIALILPNAFIAVLGFAGMILIFIAVLMPAYLLKTVQTKNKVILSFQEHFWFWASVVFGVFIILCELLNMFA